MDVDHVTRPRCLMQTIHILRAEKQTASTMFFCPLGQRDMPCVRFGVAGACPAVRIVLPHQCRITLPCLDVRQLIMAVAAPVGALKHRDSTLSADSSPGQDENTAFSLHTNCCHLPPQTGL